MIHSPARRSLRRNLGRIGRALTRAFEALASGAAPGDNVSIGIGQRHDSIIKRCLNMRLTARYGLAFAPPDSACCLLLRYGFLLAGHCFLWPSTCARIGTRALAPYRKVTAVTHAAIAADFDQPSDIHVYFTAQIALDLVLAVN